MIINEVILQTIKLGLINWEVTVMSEAESMFTLVNF